MRALGRFKRKMTVWLPALGIAVALVGLLIATGESLRHVERVAPLSGIAQSGALAGDSLPNDAGRRPGSSFWRTR